MPAYKKQLPVVEEGNRPFWEAARRHELVLQKCLDCGHIRPYPPSRICPNCLSERHEWARMSGKGTIYTFTLVYDVAHPGWKEEAPYAIVIADLQEGVRMESNTLGVRPDQLKIGQAVNVVFDDVTPEVTIPKFALG